jgi:hypothetical protein
MISILVNFKYNSLSTPGSYYNEVLKSLEELKEL